MEASASGIPTDWERHLPDVFVLEDDPKESSSIGHMSF